MRLSAAIQGTLPSRIKTRNDQVKADVGGIADARVDNDKRVP